MEKFQAKIKTLSHKGHGVVNHPDGRVFFAKGLWSDDVVEFEIPDNLKSHETISYKKILEFSDKRVTPPCPHQGVDRCGGCPWMIVDYETQIATKEAKVDFILSKNKILVENRFPFISSQEILGYRNRAQFKTNGEVLGFVTEGTNDLYPVDDCLVLNNQMRSHLKALNQMLPNPDWKMERASGWSFIEIDDSIDLKNLQINKRRPFRQGNTLQNVQMKLWLKRELEKLDRSFTVLEAFCGSGNLTETICELSFDKIIAAEVRGSALDELKSKKLLNVTVLEVNMSRFGVWNQLARFDKNAQVIIVDPPREGLEEKNGLFESFKNLQKLIYISCEPNTWARDVKDFQKKGWRVESLTPMDLFPHTPHIELLTVLVPR